MQLTLDKRFRKKLQGRIEGYDFQIGVLKDKAYKLPMRDASLGSYAGGPVRKRSPNKSGLTISQVSQENRERLGINYLSAPFKSKKNKDILRFLGVFFKVVTGRSKPKRLENLLQAVVRNPILRGDYGPNARVTKRIKGFDRAMIDTGQLFRAIVSSVKKLGGKGRV